MSHIASRGATMAVDWEQRIDFAKLRRDRLERARAHLQSSDLGALLLFDPNNIRYVTSTHIGEWARDKNARYALLPRDGDPLLWDFGSAARHHQLYAPWLPAKNCRAGVTPMRGAMPDETGVPDTLAAQVKRELEERGLSREALGIDMTDMVALDAESGETLWKFASGGSVACGPAIVNGTIYWGSGYSRLQIGTANNKLYAFTVPNGKSRGGRPE